MTEEQMNLTDGGIALPESNLGEPETSFPELTGDTDPHTVLLQGHRLEETMITRLRAENKVLMDMIQNKKEQLTVLKKQEERLQNAIRQCLQ